MSQPLPLSAPAAPAAPPSPPISQAPWHTQRDAVALAVHTLDELGREDLAADLEAVAEARGIYYPPQTPPPLPVDPPVSDASPDARTYEMIGHAVRALAWVDAELGDLQNYVAEIYAAEAAARRGVVG